MSSSPTHPSRAGQTEHISNEADDDHQYGGPATNTQEIRKNVK